MQSHAGRAREMRLAPRQPPAAREPATGKPGAGNGAGIGERFSEIRRPRRWSRDRRYGRERLRAKGQARPEQRGQSLRNHRSRVGACAGAPGPARVSPGASAQDQRWVPSATSAPRHGSGIPRPSDRPEARPGPALPAPGTAAPGPGDSRSRGTSRHDPPPEPPRARTVPRAPEQPRDSPASAALPRPSRAGSPGTSCPSGPCCCGPGSVAADTTKGGRGGAAPR